jgi:hypothetical protein
MGPVMERRRWGRREIPRSSSGPKDTRDAKLDTRTPPTGLPSAIMVSVVEFLVVHADQTHLVAHERLAALGGGRPR